MKAKNS